MKPAVASQAGDFVGEKQAMLGGQRLEKSLVECGQFMTVPYDVGLFFMQCCSSGSHNSSCWWANPES